MITDLFFRKERSDQKIKIGWMFVLLSLFSINLVKANGDASGDIGIILQVNGGGNTMYKLYDNSGSNMGTCNGYNLDTATNFSGANLGNVTSLNLKGMAIVGWTDNGDWVSGRIEYKIWKVGDAEPGTFPSNFEIGNYGNCGGATHVSCSSGIDRFVRWDGSTINLLSGLAPGQYNIKVFPRGKMRYNCGEFNLRDRAHVSATFAIVGGSNDSPSAQTAASNGKCDRISLGWTKNGLNADVMVVRSTDASFTAPTNGTSYSVGNSLGGDTVVYKGNGTSFTDTGLTAGTQYYYAFYSEYLTDYSSSVTANATTNTGCVEDPNDGNLDPTQANASGIYESYLGVIFGTLDNVFDMDGNYNSANSTSLTIPDQEPGGTFSIGTEAKVFQKGTHKVCGCSSWVYAYDSTVSPSLAPTEADFPLPAQGSKTGWDLTQKIGKFTLLQHSLPNYDGKGNVQMSRYNGAINGTGCQHTTDVSGAGAANQCADAPENTTSDLLTNGGRDGYNGALLNQTIKYKGFVSSNPTGISAVTSPVNPIKLQTCITTYRIAVAMLAWVQTGAGKDCPYNGNGTVNSNYSDGDDLATIIYHRDINLNKTTTFSSRNVQLNPAHPQATSKRWVKNKLASYLAPFTTQAACEAASATIRQADGSTSTTGSTGAGTCSEKKNSLTDIFYTIQVTNSGSGGTWSYDFNGKTLDTTKKWCPRSVVGAANCAPGGSGWQVAGPDLTDSKMENLMIGSVHSLTTGTVTPTMLMAGQNHIKVNNLAVQDGFTLEIPSGQSVTVLNNAYTVDLATSGTIVPGDSWSSTNTTLNNSPSVAWPGLEDYNNTIPANKNTNNTTGTGLILIKNGGNFIQNCNLCTGPRIQLETQTRQIANHAWVHRARPIVAPANTTYGDATKQDKRGQNGSTTINGVNYANELFNNTAGVNTTNNVQIKATATTEAYLNNNVSNADVAEYKNNIFRLVGSSWNAVSGTSSTIAPGEGWIIRTGGRRFWDGAVDANQVVTKAPNVGGNIPYPYTTAAGLSLFGTKTLTARDMVFRGQANNGVYLVDISATTANAGAINHNVLNGQVLLGNPYPSAIDANVFLNHPENSEIASAIYTWTSPRIGEDGKYPHASSFAVYNLTGGTTVDGTTNGNTSFTAGRYIAPGQGFQVQKLENGNNTLRFENSMRVGAPESTDGRKFARTKKETSTDKRVWVSLTNKFDGNQANILVGYVKNSTRAYDRRYDAVCLESPFKLYSKIDSSDVRELSIQGKGDFDKDDKVILGIVNNNPKGENKLTLKLEKTEGLENTEVILKDKTDKKEINLSKEGEYTFALKPEEKVVENRFEIVYNVKEIVTEEAKEVKTEVALNKGQVLVKSAKEVSKVEVYDLTGRLVRSYSAKGTSFAGAFNAAKSSYIVKVTASNGEVTSHKVSNE